MRYLLIANIFLPLLLTGCFPKPLVTAPGVQGTVIDARTGQPLLSAMIESIEVNARGEFTLPALQEWGMSFPFVGGIYPIERAFTVSAPGYWTRYCSCTTITPDPDCTGLVIPLVKAPPASANKKVLVELGKDASVGDHASCSSRSMVSP